MVDDDEAPGGSDRRASERRRYNRRRPEDAATPPYYEAFERIALALEGIRDQLTVRTQINLPADPAGTAPRPRGEARRG